MDIPKLLGKLMTDKSNFDKISISILLVAQIRLKSFKYTHLETLHYK